MYSYSLRLYDKTKVLYKMKIVNFSMLNRKCYGNFFMQICYVLLSVITSIVFAYYEMQLGVLKFKINIEDP